MVTSHHGTKIDAERQAENEALLKVDSMAGKDSQSGGK